MWHRSCCFAAKLVPLAYGIKKLQISCVVEDEKVRLCAVCELWSLEREELIVFFVIADWYRLFGGENHCF